MNGSIEESHTHFSVSENRQVRLLLGACINCAKPKCHKEPKGSLSFSLLSSLFQASTGTTAHGPTSRGSRTRNEKRTLQGSFFFTCRLHLSSWKHFTSLGNFCHILPSLSKEIATAIFAEKSTHHYHIKSSPFTNLHVVIIPVAF